MSRRRTMALSLLLCVLLLPLARCERPPQRGRSVHGLSVRLLTEAMSVRSGFGEPLGGYLAEYELDFEKRRVFIALDILKYEKGEWLALNGTLIEDSVRLSFGDEAAADVPVLHVEKAEPLKINPEVEKLLSTPEKKR